MGKEAGTNNNNDKIRSCGAAAAIKHDWFTCSAVSDKILARPFPDKQSPLSTTCQANYNVYGKFVLKKLVFAVAAVGRTSHDLSDQSLSNNLSRIFHLEN